LLVVENIVDSEDIGNLKEAYFKYKISILFESVGESFRFNSINRFVQAHTFSNNYLSKFTGHYSSSLIEDCLHYRHIDYDFYLASKHTPLEELCTRETPMSRSDKCLRKLIKDRNDPIPSGWVRKCYEEEGEWDFREQNGWIIPRKIYNGYNRSSAEL
jgi:hypothetical protein